MMNGKKTKHQQHQQQRVCLSRRRVSGGGGTRVTVVAAASAAEADEGFDAMEVFSPSKINLFLRIVRRREDGFHDLASLFHVIDLGDDMKFAKSSSPNRDTLVCSDDTIPLDRNNLVIKALDLFRVKTRIQQYFWVELVKKVPHGAGLGGGSGNAATALWAANELCGRPATEEQLLEWSGDIGSDISVFFSEGAAYCTGRGEIVEDVEPPLPLTTPILLVKPDVGLSTPQIFQALDLDGGDRGDAGPTTSTFFFFSCLFEASTPLFFALLSLTPQRVPLKRPRRLHCVIYALERASECAHTRVLRTSSAPYGAVAARLIRWS